MSRQRQELLSQDDMFGAQSSATKVPSLIKWTGSKRLLAPHIAALIPSHRRYFEPFLGGGSVLFFAAGPNSVACDVYKPLVGLWKLLKQDPRGVCDDYRRQWTRLTDELDGLDIANLPADTPLPSYFYEVRDRFNREHNPLDLNLIMRTCVNGIVRFNSRGEFNNSFHLSRRGMEPARFDKVVSAWKRALQCTNFYCQDYQQALEDARAGDFVYFDPPYAANKQRYIAQTDLGQFFGALEELNRKKVKWALSFDGSRGARDMTHDVPKELYRRHLRLSGGNSAVNRVLNGPLEEVEESLYLNY